MFKNYDLRLGRTFAALADPTRRRLVARLREHEGLSVSELARPFPISLPAVMKHLDVLSGAGLISRSKAGRIVSCRLTPAPMEEAVDWLNRYHHFWSRQLDRLAAVVEEEDPGPPPPAQPRSSSRAGSKHLGRKSTRRGPPRPS
ncbi:MAG: metalloregulator ArsR/SmtB family transcription factor [Gemmatimonadota bacterium]|nr:metalloregulator ArsR/SmtB family transcription factor [Gemmatimonadota bacterium]